MRPAKRAKRSLRTLKTYLGRVMRDIERAIKRQPGLNAAFRRELYLAGRVLTQKRGERGSKVYSLHAPEVECIGGANVYRERQALTKGKAHKPYEFGVKVSVATTLKRSRGGQFVLHAKALPGNPYDGHTLETVLPGIEAITGAALSRILADAGYKGHNAPPEHKLKVYTQGQKRGVTEAIKRQLKRRAAIEPAIGHCKEDHRMAGTSSPIATAEERLAAEPWFAPFFFLPQRDNSITPVRPGGQATLTASLSAIG